MTNLIYIYTDKNGKETVYRTLKEAKAAVANGGQYRTDYEKIEENVINYKPTWQVLKERKEREILK